jgi:pimeloyl-ACP methyl ester carboxylesterase
LLDIQTGLIVSSSTGAVPCRRGGSGSRSSGWRWYRRSFTESWWNDLIAHVVGIAPSGMDRFATDMRAASPKAFRRAFAEANSIRISPEEVTASNPTLLVAGEREPTIVRASNAALAALMPNAIARFAPGRGHGWLAVDPEIHYRMVEAWIEGQELPAELPTETTPWSRAKVARLVGRPEPELEGPRQR